MEDHEEITEAEPSPERTPVAFEVDPDYVAALELEREQLVNTLASVHGWLMRRVVCRPKAEIEELFKGTEYESKIHPAKRKV